LPKSCERVGNEKQNKMERIEEKKFQKLEENDMMEIEGGTVYNAKDCTETKYAAYGHVYDDMRAPDGTRLEHHFLGLWW